MDRGSTALVQHFVAQNFQLTERTLIGQINHNFKYCKVAEKEDFFTDLQEIIIMGQAYWRRRLDTGSTFWYEEQL